MAGLEALPPPCATHLYQKQRRSEKRIVELVELRGGSKVGGQMKRFFLERVRLRMSGRGRGMVEGTVEERTELGRGMGLSCG